jgi:hypothetical protein
MALTLPFPKGKKSVSKPIGGGAADVPDAVRRQMTDLRLQLEIQRLILERYQRFIEDGEAKYIAELRELVRPMDSVVTELKIQIQDQFHPYLYEQHFLPAVQKCLDLLFSYRSVSLPVNFWMSFSDMARLRAADDIDRAILLCSLLRALGSESSRVLIDKNKGAWVSYVYADKQYVVDIAKRVMSAYPLQDEALAAFMRAVQYAFNDKEYEDLSESE